MYRLLSIATVGASIAVLTPNPIADDLMVNGLKSSNITVDKVDGDRILYKTQSGSPSDKSINDKLQLVITDEPNLATAEDAFIKLKYSDAVDGYQKVLRTTSKPWLKDYAAFRLVKSGEKADRFDAVVTGYLVILQKNPTFAKDMKLNIPTDPKNSYLATAAKQIDAAITATKDPAISSSLVSFRMTIAKSMGDQAKVLELANVLTKGANSGNPTNVDATTLSNIVEGNISLITASVEKKD